MPTHNLRADADELARAALAAVEPAAAVHRHVRREGDVLVVANRRYDLRDYERVFVPWSPRLRIPSAAGWPRAS
jgi:glycerate 2-kinase